MPVIARTASRTLTAGALCLAALSTAAAPAMPAAPAAKDSITVTQATIEGDTLVVTVASSCTDDGIPYTALHATVRIRQRSSDGFGFLHRAPASEGDVRIGACDGVQHEDTYEVKGLPGTIWARGTAIADTLLEGSVRHPGASDNYYILAGTDDQPITLK